MRRALPPVALITLATLGALAGCKKEPTDSAAGGSGGEGGSHPQPVVTETHPNLPPLPGFTSCDVVVTEHATFEGHTHQPVCTKITYVSNPPTSGDHWPVWAMFKQYDAPVPHEMLVHDLEHGAIVLLHNCPGCSEVAPALAAAREKFGPDPLCVAQNPAGPTARFIIAPDTKIKTPIAISGWRASYTATCLDTAGIQDFIANHYGKGTESLCNDGKDPADPATGIPLCM